ncbi:glycoside hydrolase family 16 protein [Suillus subalutaceus]|uniref:glycoside hydrolase family 16 protein n=1 Tax=Suillus subalutaceus TaxID=48586 RepID=UPI001B875F6A|nr:glycoside hydrolase family 16 protein [Suillus subalutaceus]KAG1867837.1 glycoside hydrolase family 16 protein [Suillus subalutaceus]
MHTFLPLIALALASLSLVQGKSLILTHTHKAAVKHSAGLARDLRVAFGGILATQPSSSSNQNFYCVGSDGEGVSMPPSSNSSSSPTTNGNPTSTGTAAPSSTSVAPSSWKVAESYSGKTFFNGWTFFTTADPTNGNVQYVDQSTAQSAGLVEINSDGNAVMRVETTPQVQTNRQSVRITTQATFNGGLVVMDAVHMPTGCGTWPAFWTNGPNWPAGGEIDIVEGVNNYTNNQATIHTNPGCVLPSSSSASLNISGTLVASTDCSASQTDNQGCGIRSNSSNSFGSGFNEIGGGVYAMLWDDTGIKVYFFPRGSIPSDISAKAPQPQNWPAPMADWPSTDCNPYQFFNNNSAIFDTTLCGDWAGGVWTGTGVPGQTVSCAQQTGFSTCSAFVQASGGSFTEAYWEVSSVVIYQNTS